MNLTIQRALLAVAVATIGAGAVGTASAQTAGTPGTAPPQHARHGHFRHFGGSRFVGSLLRATGQLGLSTTEQNNIKSILASSRPNRQPGTQLKGPGITVLGNPHDSNFAAAVQSAEASATARIQKESALEQQIYDALTPEHQAALPGVLASIQAKEEARRAAWAAKRSSNG